MGVEQFKITLMKINTLILTAFFGILLFGCSIEDDSPILPIIDIESEKALVKKPSIEETIELSKFN